MTPGAATARSVSFGTPTGRIVLLTTILASGMAFLDGSVVNVALPHIDADLGGGFATMQWVVDAFLLTLGSLVLVGGALGDLLGIRRVYVWGITGFAAASLLCGIAPTAFVLTLARGVQGAAAALMVPGSLALISSLFVASQRGRAIGLWSGLTGMVAVAGPFVGGAIVDLSATGWRLIFFLNLPLAVVVLLLTRRVPGVPGRRRAGDPLRRQLDLAGAALTVAGLACIVGAAIEAERLGTLITVVFVAIGVVLLGVFWMLELRLSRTGRPPPMLPPGLWRVRSFTVANVVTLVVYGALGAVLMLNSVAFQIGLGWSALAAGAAGIPVTIMLALLSARVGGLIPRLGARPLLTGGCLIMSAGLGWLSRLPAAATYWSDVLPALLVFGVGLSFLVAPITTTALGDIPVASSGIGSGVNNAVARVAGLVAVAVIPLAAGLTGFSASSGGDVLPGFHRATLICAASCLLGAVLSWFGFSRETGRGDR